MKPNYRFYFLFILMITSITVSGQKTELRKANGFYDQGEYFQALDLYNRAKDKGASFDNETKAQIAKCYFELKNTNEALNRYMEIEASLKGNHVFTYASCYHQIGAFELAEVWYEKAKKSGSNPVQMNEYIKACNWANENRQFRDDVVINPAPFAIGGQSFGIHYFKEGVVYSAADRGGSKKLDKQGKAFLNMVYSPIIDGEMQEEKTVFSKNLTADTHVGATAFTSDYSRIFFSKSVRVKGGKSVIKIFTARFDGNDWVDEKEASISSDDYEVAYPSVSPDDKFLYYTSTERGGLGGKDLYRATLKTNGQLGKGENLGNDINTYGDERWPVISPDNKLYFASDGHYGFGGLDIFEAEYVSGKWTNPRNMLQPFNSNKDDFQYVQDPKDPTLGFISSNRSGSGENDVIYTVRPKAEDTGEDEGDKIPVAGLDQIPVFGDETITETAPPVVELPVETPVIEKPVVETPVVEPPLDLSMFPAAFATKMTSTFNGDVIEGVKVVIKDANTGQLVGSGTSDSNGVLKISIPDEYKNDQQEFEIEISKGKDFNSKRMIVHIMELDDISNNGLSLTPIFDDLVLDEISKMVIAYDGTNFDQKANATLDKLAAFLIQNPNIVIRLNGHTEAKGNKLKNLDDSQDMADKAEQHLLSKGVEDKNVIPRGYGERYLLNKCRRGVYCEASQHKQNRRIEVVVWKILK
ncbi:MAG: PD40 domain-containing protein [Marinilabiliaceae bacterium]|nr:PD40 domain-containing protein [Marinilabiliaceae bacterium]